ncbi:MAG: PrsW family intramembrane metalloprotease [Thermoflexales bacterium]|nr:PrsW family intramembrane metalloprotease [Thermoflexales bacterium]MDW8350796.1 PrsW family intramembrane metalloprotease [Anaerolineae bacterium]
MPVWLSAILIAIPTLWYARLVRSIDRFEQEPAKYLIVAFLWGALPAAFIALVLQLVFALPVSYVLGEEASMTTTSIVAAPLTEELAKGLAVAAIYLWRRREFDGWVDGIVYGSTVGFGFAYVENIIYLANTEGLGGWVQLFILRVIVFGFMHGFYTSLIGIGFGLARHAPSRAQATGFITLGFAAAIITHAVHNASVSWVEVSGGSTLLVTALNYGLLIVLMLGLRWLSARNDRRMFRTYLADESPHVITPEAYTALAGMPASAGARHTPRLSSAFYHLAGELAQRKRQLIEYGEGSVEEIDRLRAQLRALSYPHAQASPAPQATDVTHRG